LPALTTELGLSSAEPAALWRALLPNEPVPRSLDGVWDESQAPVPTLPESAGSAAAEEGMSVGLPSSQAASVDDGGVGTTRAALSEDEFFRAGGCAIQPTPTGAVFQGQNPNSPYCAPRSSGDGWVALRSAEVRVRINVYAGSFLNLKISRDGSAVAFVGVQKDWWINQRHFNNDHRVKTCRGVFTRTCRIDWLPTPSLWRVDVQNATGDSYHIGAVWFDDIDSRADAQPW
jgi:hypothetical protein